jgi:hypothetical protein
MSSARDGLARFLQVQLARHAKSAGMDTNLVLTRYAVERFLYRLSRSPHVERFVLKGALLLLVWLGDTLRPTRDADLLGFGELSDAELVSIFRQICETAVEEDGMSYAGDSIRVEPIRVEDNYGGQRVCDALKARLAEAQNIKIRLADAIVEQVVAGG